jgi:hypothetical protein
MKNPPPPVSIDTALALPWVIGMSLLVGGLELGVGVAVSGAVVVLNMAILHWLVRGYISSLAGTGRGGVAAFALLFKFWVSIMVFLGLMSWVGPLAVGLSWISVGLGVAGRGIWLYVGPSNGVDGEEPA